ncbi:site-specific integrase [Streptomyces sp. NPDC059697]|uniref:site-specific integrase n=1 Tax=Streptomyces sp. NPDC059697 TaxID=3346912 RepID=UPI00368ED049
MLIWNFDEIRNPRWRVLAKEYLTALCAPGHERVRVLAAAHRVPRTVRTCHDRFQQLTRWLNCLTTQGVTSLAEVTQHHCTVHLQHRCAGRTGDEPARPAQLTVVQVLQELADYGELFTTDHYPSGFRPWDRQLAHVVAGVSKNSGENKTPPARAEVMAPLLTATLFLIHTLAPRALAQAKICDAPRPQPPGPVRTATTAHFEQAVRAHLVSGEPFEQDEDRSVRHKLTHGWDRADPLLKVNFAALALEGGVRTRSGHPFRPGPGFLRDPRTAAVRPLLEQAIAEVGVQPRWGRGAELIDRADGAGAVAWTLPITQDGLARLLSHVRTACILTIAALSGMRTSELIELPLDCQLAPCSYGPNRVRHRLKSKVIKHRGPGGSWDEWVVVPEAYEAVGIARELADPGAAHLFPAHLDLCRRYRELREWVNGGEGQRLGLPHLPDDVLTARILRRTLAVELAHRPGGLFAAKLQLKHLSVTTTEGYANRPGGAQALFLAEVGKEEESRNQTLTLRAFRDYQAGRRPSGPGARDLLAFLRQCRAPAGRAGRDGSHGQAQRSGTAQPAGQMGRRPAPGAGELLLVPRPGQGPVSHPRPQRRARPAAGRDVRLGPLPAGHPSLLPP